MMDLVEVSEGDEPATAAAAEPAKPAGLPKNAVLNDDGTITLTLEWPASLKTKDAQGNINEEPIGDKLVFNRLRGVDMRAMMNSDEKNGSLLLFYRSIRAGDGRGPRIFDALDAIDAKAALEIVGFLTGAGRKTGG